MTYHQACQKVNIAPQVRSKYKKVKKYTFTPHEVSPTHSSWKQVAKRFINYCHENLIKEPIVINQLEQRGLTLDTIKQFSLGWNPKNLFDQRERWGFHSGTKENGLLKRQWLPKGIVIPSFEDSNPIKLKIRRSDWFINDPLPKYVEIAGGKQSPSIYGNISKPVIIVESELDAILIQQEASNLACSIALGGVSKKPDTELHELLKRAPLILLSLDFDDSGKKHNSFWMKNYPNLKPWPSPQAKCSGDGIQHYNLNIVEWLKMAFHNN
jgi:hypothetical protein